MNFTPLRPVRSSANGSPAALHQYHLFPTCIVADDDLVVCGSGCYETVADPTTLMIGPRILQVFDAHSGKIVRSIPAHPSSILDVKLDANYIYSCSNDRSIAIWDRNTGEHVSSLYGHLKSVYQIMLYDNILISAGKDKTIRFWDPKVRDNPDLENAFAPVEAPPPVRVTFGVGRDKVRLSPSGDQNIRAGSRGLQSVILAHEHSVRRFAASDGALMSIAGDSQGCHWDIETNQLIRSLTIVDEAVAVDMLHNDVVISNGLLSQHYDMRVPGTIPVRQCEEGGGREIFMDSCKMIMADHKGFVRVWDWGIFREVNSFRSAKHRCTFYYDHSSERLYTGGTDKFVKLYDFSTRPADLSPSPPEKKCAVM